MNLEFLLRIEFGKRRYYPTNKLGKKILLLLGRRSFTEEQIALLASCEEFNIKVLSEKELKDEQN